VNVFQRLAFSLLGLCIEHHLSFRSLLTHSPWRWQRQCASKRRSSCNTRCGFVAKA